MASLTLTGGTLQFSWRITELSAAFGQNNGYAQAGITRYPFIQSASSISGVVDSVSAPTTGASTSTSVRTVSYSPGEYQFWAFTRVNDGTYWPAGTATVIVEDEAVVRPSNWSWSFTVSPGQPIQITADEFNNFLDRINEFREYVGLPSYGAFERAYRGNKITANIVKHAVWAIGAMNPPTSTPSSPSAGDMITASFFNGLQNSLNSIL